MLQASGLDADVAREVWSRMLEVSPTRGTYACLGLTERKTAEIAERGFQIVGHVLVDADGRFCLSSQAAVRWLSTDHYNQLMHAPNEKLFGKAPESLQPSQP